jgi:tRNA(fMet)-specific endonuclease VapC
LTGEIYDRLEENRQRIGVADTAIAATGIQQKLVVVTSNTKHYQRIVDLGFPLRLESWRDG